MIGTTTEKEEQRKHVQIVNGLIGIVFGKDHNGTWSYDSSIAHKKPEKGTELNYIAREDLMGRCESQEPVARFDRENGSEITVPVENYPQTVFLATLYEKAFPGKEMKIETRNHSVLRRSYGEVA